MNVPRQNDDKLDEEEATAAPRIVAAAAEAANEPELDAGADSAAADVSLQAAASTRPPSVARPRRSILEARFVWTNKQRGSFFFFFLSLRGRRRV